MPKKTHKAAGPAPTLGLVCMTNSDEVRFRTITRTRLHALPPAAQEAALLDIYRDNAERLGRGFRFCKRLGIGLFRMSSDLFPFADTPLGARLLDGMAADLSRLGQEAAGLRLTMHPDQFVVLSSDRPEVVRNSVVILEMHARVMDLLGLPRSPWAAITIHGGKGGRGPALAERVRALPDSVRTRLTLENDERAYSAAEIAAICGEAGVPMIFDAHHHVIHDRLDSYDDESVLRHLLLARATWPDPAWQLVHISNGRAKFSDNSHSDLITQMPACYRAAPYIEVEAKAKEEAIAALRGMGW